MNVGWFNKKFCISCFFIRLLLQGREWLTDGMELVNDETNIELTSCRSTLLTDFAGGFLVRPTQVDFGSVFVNASFADHPTIFITVIVLVCVYALAAVFCVFMVRVIKKKTEIHVLKSDGDYFYEVVLFTGLRKDAGTNSDVYMSLLGIRSHSVTLQLKSNDQNDDKYLIRRSAVKTFILSTDKALGSLYMCRVFHDNEAKSKQKASWYLRHVFVIDLQTEKRYVFICENGNIV
ncbi:polycystin-1-like isoform X2 [Brachionus plicatilis]|uniref:Polycystin-1-like isoform X2 n=1 Tax=Brachionus plicatilis TaxID=10195 RepID=A0A3M7PJF9_BRAPC|nr:polycystin-1-like isoform X2 [Brachionus plicatilis]